jgi:LysR family transcriptional regulator, nod-box dependent transcriptional activator
LPARIAEELARHHPLAIRALPFTSPVIGTTMIWPRWFDNQPAHAWMRNVIFSASRDLAGNAKEK